MNVLFITTDPINVVGGLERSSSFFITWLKENSNKVFTIHKKNFLRFNKYFLSCDLVLLIGHRSIFIMFCAILSLALKKKVAWCTFWHDYKLEKNKKLFLYKIYDMFFIYLFKKVNYNFVVSEYEAKKIAETKKLRKIILPNFFLCRKDELNNERKIDVLIPGRDVPHKRFSLIRDICIELGLSYLETSKNYLSEEELKNAYLSSKYIFIPSLYESYSYVALEGMSCGCNVLVSSSVMVKYQLEKYNNFKILDSNNWNAKSVKYLLETFPPNHQNIHNALEIQSLFSSKACKEKFLKSFNLN